MKKISLLVSTSNKRINNVCLPKNEEFSSIIVHQVYDSLLTESFNLSSKTKYQRLNFPGLSKSRNTALDLCETQYAYIMDDDVDIEPDQIKRLVQLMEEDKVDIATCQFQYQNGSFPKLYSRSPFIHNILSIAKVASIEICINMKSLNKHHIRFDENFGLGSNLPSGEEYIFLADCLKAGLKIKYYPVIISTHPNETSGLDFYTNTSKTLAKRKMLQRVFGWKSIIFILAFWVKKLPVVYRAGYGLSFTKTMLFGVK